MNEPDFEQEAIRALDQWDLNRVRYAVSAMGRAMYEAGIAAGKAESAAPPESLCASCGKGVDRHDSVNGLCFDVDYSGGQRWSFAMPGDSRSMAWTEFERRWKRVRS